MDKNSTSIHCKCQFSYDGHSDLVAGDHQTSAITHADNSRRFSRLFDLTSNIQWNFVPGSGLSLRYPSIKPSTRCLQESHEQRKTYLPEDETEMSKIAGPCMPSRIPTYLLPSFTHSFNLLTIVQLQCDDGMIKQLREILPRIFLTSNDEQIVRRNVIELKPDILQMSIPNKDNNNPFSLLEHVQCSGHLLNLQLIESNSLFLQQRQEIQQNETPTPSSSNDTINVLLLGETGVGKSTFINAFANYLTFDTLQQAETGHPVVLIPVSFLITTGDDFDEHIVKFTNTGGTENEDFAHVGQSVTQHCRSYVLDVKDNDGKQLRIIDTPGFGDTRGLDQDDKNMLHILEYLKDFSHLNAVCCLFKPNESRLNILFRSCLPSLFSLFGSNIAENLLFCFTNARSTFYTPGNTGPLLKKMLASLLQTNVQLNKNNCFCFDSESFRYLVSLQNQILFTDCDREDYEKSWTKSVAETKRLVRYINTALHPKMVGLASIIT